ncbi:MAG: hypothetical protein JWQ27_713 [Ferruginibacter sp.]|nr:hypothetical protein [Ferruginibacter sp.]
MKKLLLVVCIISTLNVFACECIEIPVFQRYQQADFIATVNVLRTYPDKDNADYLNADIAVVDLFKGKQISVLKLGEQKTNCGIILPPDTKWLIFASYDKMGKLQINACSGSVQMSGMLDDPRYPGLNLKLEKKIAATISVLQFLERNAAKQNNPYLLQAGKTDSCRLIGNKTNAKERSFAAFEIRVNADLSVNKIKTLKSFDDKKLSATLSKCLEKNIQIRKPGTSIPKHKSRLLLFYFYYPAEGEHKSFVSQTLL